MATGTVTDIKVKVVYSKGTCPYGHQVGEEWVVGLKTPLGICNSAYISLYPHIRVLQRGGQYQYPPGSGVIRLGCPDVWNLVVFEMSAMPGTTCPAPSPHPGSGLLENL